jgi:enterobactin synthetase component F
MGVHGNDANLVWSNEKNPACSLPFWRIQEAFAMADPDLNNESPSLSFLALQPPGDIGLRLDDQPSAAPAPNLAAARLLPRSSASKDPLPGGQAPGAGSPADAIDTIEAPPRLPLSVAQRGLWVGQKIGGPAVVLNIAEAIEIHGPIDAALFSAALRQVAAEAETIRVEIVEGSDGPRQVIRPVFPGDFPVIDVSGEPDPRQAAEDRMMRELLKPVDFARDPLWVSALFKAAPDRFFWYHRSHHIIMDGFTGGMVARRVAELYSAFVEEREPAPHQFGALATLVENEAVYRRSERFERDRAFWRDQLSGLPDAISFARKRMPGFGGLFRKTTHLSPESSARLHELAKGAAGSLPQILIALAAAFFHRITGAEDLIFGLPVTARPNGQLRRIPGMVANAVPIRLAMSPALTLRELIQQVAGAVRQALRHQQYRYEDLRRDLGQVGRHQQISWLGVNIEPFDYDLRFGGHRATTHNLSNGSVEDLTIFIYDRDDGAGLRIDFDANRALYTPEELAAHQARFLRLIEGILDRPEQRIGEIDLLDAAERHTVLTAWNRTAHPVPAALPVEQFEARARACPDAIAVEAADAVLTYAELNAQANFWAYALIERGVGPGDIVALAVPRTTMLPIALLAILKSGAAYLPLDPDQPSERLATMLEAARPAALLTTAVILPRLPPQATPTLLLDRPTGKPDAGRFVMPDPDDTDRRQPLTPAAPAYVIFTSGSSGRPKGVVVSNRNLTNLLAALRVELGFCARDRLLAVTTIAFDIATLEIFAPLLAGGCVVIAPREVVRAPAALIRLMRAAKITVMQATPSLWQAVLDIDDSAVKGLRVLVGGEALPASLAQALRRSAAAVTNLYGPTETTIWSTALALDGADLDAPPIGRPIWNTQTYVLDASLQPCPVGVAGDLYIAGAGVAEGYLNRPDLTAERFIANPFGPPGSRCYRTGDLAQWRADGVLEFLGRSDQQIKIRGFRVETAEVETTLMRCAGIRQAIVTARDDLGDGKRLVAYLVPAEGAVPDPVALRCELADFLPEYMIPSAFVPLDALPLTANGKLDRRALPAPERALAAGYVVPRTPTEERLASLWAAELGLERVGIHDNFFDLGGDSLMAARLILAIETAFAVEVSLATLFNASTVAELAAQLHGDGSSDPLGVLLPLRAQGDGAPIFCIHPVIGLGWAYAGLLRHIDAAHPVYALQARGLNGQEALPLSLEAMAEDYLEQIRLVQPRGPYHLVGWSLGGLIGFEIARQLRLAGETIGLLALLDAYPFLPIEPGGEPAEADLVRAALGFLGYQPGAPGDVPPDMASLADFLCREYDVASMPLVQQMRRDNADIIGSVIEITRNNLALARRFVPRRAEFDLLVFRATEGKPATLDGLLDHHPGAWERHVAGMVREHRIACHHQDMLDGRPLDDIARILAREFAAHVRSAESDPLGRPDPELQALPCA